MKKTIFLTGGGTGGHIWPLITLAKKLSQKYRIIFVGQKGGMEEPIVLKEKLIFEGINCAKLQGLSVLNPMTWITIIRGFFQSWRLVVKYRPRLIFAKGGFVSFPVALAGICRNVKLIVHESDSVIGRSNQILGWFAFRFLTAFDIGYYPRRYHSKMIKVSIPVRSGFRPAPFPKSHQVLFVGGSQGSVFINQLVKEILPQLAKEARVVHICGRDNLPQMEEFRQKLKKDLQKRYQLIGFTDRIAGLIKKSTIVVSRAGATTLAEAAAIRRPLILIPFRYAAGGHQMKNAVILKAKNAALVFREKGLKPKQLKEAIDRLLKDRKRRHQLAENLGRFLTLDSERKIEQIIDSII